MPSKPLQANAPNFSGDENDPGIRRARMNRSPERLGWRLLEPVAFVDLPRSPGCSVGGRDRRNGKLNMYEWPAGRV